MDQYVILVVPPQEIIDKVNVYRQKYASHTEYVIDPHFTIYPPFSIISGDENNLINILKSGFINAESNIIYFENIGYFEGKNNVAFFNPSKPSINYLKNLLTKATDLIKNNVKNVYDDYNFTPEKFNPHMTIAERIPDDSFQNVKNELNKVSEKGSFNVSSIFLYKYNLATKQWLSISEIKF